MVHFVMFSLRMSTALQHSGVAVEESREELPLVLVHLDPSCLHVAAALMWNGAAVDDCEEELPKYGPPGFVLSAYGCCSDAEWCGS